MRLMLATTAAILLMFAGTASALTVEVRVTKSYLQAHPNAFSISAEKRDNGLFHFTVTRHLSEPRYLVAHFKVRDRGSVLMESHFPAFIREKTATYYFVVAPEHLPEAQLDLSEHFFNMEGQTPVPRPGGTVYQIQLSDFAPQDAGGAAEEAITESCG